MHILEEDLILEGTAVWLGTAEYDTCVDWTGAAGIEDTERGTADSDAG